MATALFTGCFGSGSEVGPKETIQTFYKHICAGDFSEAQALCKSEDMQEYMDTFRSAWEKTDPALSSIAADILSNMTVTITDEQKSGQSRTIFYKLSTTEGSSKEKIATLMKEEGEWRIVAITDRH